MGFARGFLEYDRIESAHEEVKTRIKHHHEFIKTLSASEIKIHWHIAPTNNFLTFS